MIKIPSKQDLEMQVRGIEVKSDSLEGTYYNIYKDKNGNWKCTCPGFNKSKNKVCKHLFKYFNNQLPSLITN